MSKPYDEPSNVEGYGGEVMVEGPDGIDVSLTPKAAIITGARLIEAGVEVLTSSKHSLDGTEG